MVIYYMVGIFRIVKAIAPTVFPIYQGNPLVFFTPGLLEFVFIIVSVLIGKLVEIGVIKALTKSKG